MGNLDKFLNSLPSKDRLRTKEVMKQIRASNFSNLDIKKLKGIKDTFRVRIGKYRIVYEKHLKFGYIIVSATRRTDTTYNF